jgi:hypothetical protein
MKWLLAIIVVFLVAGKCKKDSVKICELQASTITDSRYRITTLLIDGADSTLTSIPVCKRDDVYEFKANGVFNYLDGSAACVPDGSFTGNWQILNNDLLLNGVINDVVKFACNGFETLSFRTVSGNQIPVLTIYTKIN